MSATHPIRFQLPGDPQIREVQRRITAYEPTPPPFLTVTVRSLDNRKLSEITLPRSGFHDGKPFYKETKRNV